MYNVLMLKRTRRVLPLILLAIVALGFKAWERYDPAIKEWQWALLIVVIPLVVWVFLEERAQARDQQNK